MLTIESIIHLVISLLMAALLVAAIRQLRRKSNSYGLIIVALISGLIYENLILGLGGLIGYGDTLKMLNTPRFISHALFTPMLIIYAIGMARMAGLKWAQSRAWHIAFCVLATALIAFGAFQDILNLKLVPYETGSQVLGYRNEFALLKGPPIPAVSAILVIMVIGGLLLWRARWAWLLAGGVLMLIGAMLMLRFPLGGNLGELALGLAIVATFRAAERGALRASKTAQTAPA
ncbi:MAG TPA: hypothetical protein PLG23_02190 [Thermoflexales bacterium]|nr:hypothetical protein [Anaerolineae bacterium]HQV26760.1 hypothetical protein [Thermoflexales bacterium]HQX09817.1 hypothetical protein [Thermoflexales bacterium]HQY23523.1 hypothetical protein [Thermoflexales bacterium]HQZ52238.1 hypothetical protein [Thermoflexales bacterium]